MPDPSNPRLSKAEMLRLLLREYPTLTYNDLVEMADLVGFDLTEARPSNAGGSLPELSGLSTVRVLPRQPTQEVGGLGAAVPHRAYSTMMLSLRAMLDLRPGKPGAALYVFAFS